MAVFHHAELYLGGLFCSCKVNHSEPIFGACARLGGILSNCFAHVVFAIVLTGNDLK